jgi:hypothetical protein
MLFFRNFLRCLFLKKTKIEQKLIQTKVEKHSHNKKIQRHFIYELYLLTTMHCSLFGCEVFYAKLTYISMVCRRIIKLIRIYLSAR